MSSAFDIEFAGEQLVLNSDKTLWWPRRRVLFATDLHAGKTEHFRRYGLAIPGGSLEADLQRLQTAAERYKPERLLFLGDLFHSDPNTEWETFADWCRTQPYAIELVRGNHDRFLTDTMLRAANVLVHSEPYDMLPFTLRHHPAETLAKNEFVLCGHLHPVIWIHGPGRDRLRQPCFWLQPQQLILPAFGSFTGGLVVKQQLADHVYICSMDDAAIITYPG